MISVYNIKPRFQQLLQPILVRLHTMGVTPNMLTIVAILLSAFTGVYMMYGEWQSVLLAVPVALLVRMALNALDGMMARTYQMQSRVGELLNEMGDVVADLCLFVPLLGVVFLPPNLVVLFLLLSVLNEFAGVLGKAIGGERRYDGPMGKSDRALVLGLVCLLLYFYPPASQYMVYVLVLVNILLVVSTFIRLNKSLRA